MTTIRRITVSQIDGNSADSTDVNEVRPFGETAFYLDTSGNTDKLALMMFDGIRTHQKSKILSPGVLYGSNADSGDGIGYDTIKLIPDATLQYNGSQQYVIVDPTAPNHIHIRAGGEIDNSTADLFLGGELTHVKVSDNQDNVVIRTTDPVLSTTNDWMFGADGTLILPSSGQIMGNNVTVKGSSSISIKAENPLNPLTTRDWTFSGNGHLTFPDNTTQTTAYIAANNAIKTYGTWTVTPGTANYSFQVPVNGVYQLWVRANIPNGIISYTATVAVTNSNVPVLGTQYAWNYTGSGDPILFTSITDQFIGTEGGISTANPSVGTNTNIFVFGLSNSTAENVTVEWGYTKIS